MSCAHTRITPGLDALCCKDCGKWWQSWQPEYQRLLNQKCQHDWAVLWTSDLKLVDYCGLCHCSLPVSDRSTLESHRSSIQIVLADYELALSSSKKPSRRREFESAIATKKEQLKWLDQQLGLHHHPDPKIGDRGTVLGDEGLYQIQELSDREALLKSLDGSSQPTTYPLWKIQAADPESPSTDPEPDVLGDKPDPISPSTDSQANQPDLLALNSISPSTDPEPDVLGDKSEQLSPSTDPEPDVLGDKSEQLSPSTDSQANQPDLLALNSISPSTDPEPDVLGDKPEQLSPSKTRRRKGEGSGSIHWKTITRGDKEYPQAWYHYEIWEKGDRNTKKTKYIPKRLVDRIQKLELEKAPVREILKVLGKIDG